MKKNKKNNYLEKSNEDLSFLLWEAELNKELFNFWKTIIK